MIRVGEEICKVLNSRGIKTIHDKTVYDGFYNGAYEITYYSSCCNTSLGIYYYTTYENSQITGIDMHRIDLDQNELIAYPLRRTQNIYWEN